MVTRRDLVTGAATVTEEQTMLRAHFTGTVAKKRFMERRWCEKLRHAMLRVHKCKHNASIRAVERAAKRQWRKTSGSRDLIELSANAWHPPEERPKKIWGDTVANQRS